MATAFVGMMECLIYSIYYNFDFDFLINKNGQWIHTTEETLQLFGLAFLGTFSMLMAIQAFQMIEPCVCTVLRSQEIIFAYLFQAGLFHEAVEFLNIFGAFVVLMCGVLVSLEDRIMILMEKKLGITPPPWDYQYMRLGKSNDYDLADLQEGEEKEPIQEPFQVV